MNSLPSWPKNSELNTNEISIYKGELTGQCLVKSVATIKKAFPTLPIGFYDVFTDRLKANGFTDERLWDAITYVIDTCPYPTPTIANFINFDKRFKFHTYEEMLRKADELGIEAWSHFRPVKLPEREKPIWVHLDDIKKFKLEVFETKNLTNSKI